MSAVIGTGSAASQWAKQYQGAPIMLAGGTGIAPGSSPANDIPITTYTEQNGPSGIAYRPMPGASLLKNQPSTYPFANQAVAANAIIQQPVNLSMEMTCPVPPGGSWQAKTSMFNSLVQTLKQHINLGGLFNVATPAFTYTNGMLLDFRDVGQGESRNPQYKFQLDFYFPLITLDQAQQVLNTLLNNLSNQSAPNAAVPTVANALAATNVGAPQFTQALTSQLGPALLTAGLGTAQLPGVVGANVQAALSGNFSPLDLATSLANSYLPATQALGMSAGSALDLFSGNVNLALNQVGVTPNLLSNFFQASLGSVQIPGLTLPMGASVQ
jgi:hypothetical protein